MSMMTCQECGIDLVPMPRQNRYTFAAAVGALLILCGLGMIVLVLLSGPLIVALTESALTRIIAGLLLIGAGIVIDKIGSGSRIVMTCPSCRYEATDKSSISYQLGRMFGGTSK